MGASTRALVLESLVAGVFVAVAIFGFRSSLWVVVLALGAHGVFDLGHGTVMSNPGVPSWWPAFCLTYDATAAGFLAWLLTSGRITPSVAVCWADLEGRDDEWEGCMGGWNVPRLRSPTFLRAGAVSHDGLSARTDALWVMQTALHDSIASDDSAAF